MTRNRWAKLLGLVAAMAMASPSVQAKPTTLLPIPLEITGGLGITGCVSNGGSDCDAVGYGPSAYGLLMATARVMEVLGVGIGIGLDLHLGGITLEKSGNAHGTRGLTFHLFISARTYYEIVDDITLFAGFGMGYGHWFVDQWNANGSGISTVAGMFALKGSLGGNYRLTDLLSIGVIFDVIGHPDGNQTGALYTPNSELTSTRRALQPFYIAMQGGVTATLHL